MIIYGWNSKNIKQSPLEGYECPSCGEKQSVLAIFAHYVHVFWIPFFPYKKSAQVVCTHCQLSTDEKGLEESQKTIVKQLKSAVRIPKYLFVGLGLLVLAIGFISYSSNESSRKEAAYLANPQVGDVYVLKDLNTTEEYNHYLLKVNEVVDDSLWVSFSSYSYNGIVSELDPADGFYDIVYAIHKSELYKYEESGELKKALRDYPATAGFDRVIEYQLPDSLAND